MKDEIQYKSYTDLLSELEAFVLIKKLVISLSIIQLSFIYIMIRLHGIYFELIMLFIFTISFFSLPLIIELTLKNMNKKYILEKYIYQKS